jgi:hypothetical protein
MSLRDRDEERVQRALEVDGALVAGIINYRLATVATFLEVIFPAILSEFAG